MKNHLLVILLWIACQQSLCPLIWPNTNWNYFIN